MIKQAMITMYAIRRLVPALLLGLMLSFTAHAADTPGSQSAAPAFGPSDLDRAFPRSTLDIATPDALGRRALILCGDATPILEGQRRSLMRIVNEMMTAGTRILLTPVSSPVARTHNFTLEPDQFFAGPPGRGQLTSGRSLLLVQMAS